MTRVVRVSKFELKAYAVLGVTLYLMLGACARPEPFHKSVDIPPIEETPAATATFDSRTSSTRTVVRTAPPRRPVRPGPAAS